MEPRRRTTLRPSPAHACAGRRPSYSAERTAGRSIGSRGHLASLQTRRPSYARGHRREKLETRTCPL
jgi:hypothetical protein